MSEFEKRFPKETQCSICKGKGRYLHTPPCPDHIMYDAKCDWCGGTGEVEICRTSERAAWLAALEWIWTENPSPDRIAKEMLEVKDE